MSVAFDTLKVDDPADFFTYKGQLFSRVNVEYKGETLNALNIENDFYYVFDGNEEVEKV